MKFKLWAIPWDRAAGGKLPIRDGFYAAFSIREDAADRMASGKPIPIIATINKRAAPKRKRGK